MTTREQVRGYREDLDALLVLVLAELVRTWGAAGLPFPFGLGRSTSQQASGAARRSTTTSTTAAAAGTVGAAAAGAVLLDQAPSAGPSAATSAAAAASTSASSSSSSASSAAATITSTQAVEATDELLRSVPGLIADHQAAAATLGADFFDTVRTDAGIRGRFTATPVDARDDARQEILVRWATQPLRPDNMPPGADLVVDDEGLAVPDVEGALQRLIGATYRQVLDPARETVEQATGADPAGATFAREARPDCCAFCALLASRGPVYRSRALAGDGDVEGASDYHDDCRCLVVPSWPGAVYEAPEHVAEFEQSYIDARNSTGSGDPKVILAAMRKARGSR